MQNQELKRLLILQLVTVMVIPVLLIPLGSVVVKSALIAGIIVFTSTLVSSRMVFGNYTAQKPGRILVKFYSAEITKLVIFMAGFAFAIWQFQPLDFITLLAVFFVAQVFPAVFLSFR